MQHDDSAKLECFSGCTIPAALLSTDGDTNQLLSVWGSQARVGLTHQNSQLDISVHEHCRQIQMRVVF